MDHPFDKIIVTPPSMCATCGKTLMHQTRVITRTYLSDIYSFCSEHCAEKFVASPESFTDEDHEDEEV